VPEGTDSVTVALITSELGTSVMPVRFGTRAQVWLVEFRPEGE